MLYKNDFLFSSGICGFKSSKKPDLAIIYSSLPCTYAGVFTQNQVRAACIDENVRLLRKRKKVRAIVINSGNANACTGKKGYQAVLQTKKIAAKLLNIKADEVLVASTGVIGVQLDITKMKKGLELTIPKLSPKKFKAAAKAILTTDRTLKIISKKSKGFKLLGFAKGAGMIHPNMATMLCYFMTDLKIRQNLLQRALQEAVDVSFNNISVDGDMSTNDMAILLSNGQSKIEVKSKNDPVYKEFRKVLLDACWKLAKDMVRDGEGSQKIILVSVKGAKTETDARKIARSIASSTLFKCAIFGRDPNWGRAVARVGCTDVKIKPEKLDLAIFNTFVYKNGQPVLFNPKKLHKQMKKADEIKINVNLKLGKKSGVAYGCDLSYDYVELNSAYFT